MTKYDFKTEIRLCKVLQTLYDVQHDKKFMRDFRKYLKDKNSEDKA